MEVCFENILKLKSGNVWELNPLGALFKPPDGFEDHGQHQLCKHSRNQLHPPSESNITSIPIRSGIEMPSPYYPWKRA